MAQSKGQKETIDRVMHEYKHGELESAGRKVKNPKQAIAIALSESGASNRQSPEENRTRYRRTKKAEREGDTGQARSEAEPTRADLYKRAQEQNVPGRSKMTKAELAKAVD